MRRIVSDMPMVRLARWVVHRWGGVGTRKSCSGNICSDTALNGEAEVGGVGKRAAGARGQDGEVPSTGVGCGGEKNGRARACSDAERTGWTRDYAGGQACQRHLDRARKAVERSNGQDGWGASAGLLDRN